VPSVATPSLKVMEPVALVGVTAAVKVMSWPEAEGLMLDETMVVVAALFTVWVRAVLVEVPYSVLPPYTAVREWGPAERAEVT
jgi:hypothetical protein